MSVRIVTASALAACLTACARAETPGLVEQLTADLTKREGQPIDIGSIERMTVSGHAIACGYYAGRPAPGETVVPLMGPYAAVDARLVTPDPTNPLLAPCLEKVTKTVRPVA